MNKTAHLYFCLASLLCISCSNGASVIDFDDSELYSVPATDAEEQLIETGYLFCSPTQIAMADDSTLVLFDKSENGKIAHLISTDGKYIAGFGSIGQGPGEFLAPKHLSTDRRNGKIYIYDFMQCQSHVFDRDSIKEGILQTAAIDYSRFIGDGMFRFDTALHLSDTSSVCIGLNDKCRLMHISKDSIQSNYIQYPNLVENEEHNWSIWSNGAHYDISPDGNYLVWTTCIGMSFEILNLKDGQINSHVLKGFHKPTYRIAEGAVPACAVYADDTFEGFRAICTADNGFYGCIGGDAPDYDESTTIYYFDYDGNLKKKIRTSSSIECLTANGSALYILSVNPEGEYSLKRINNRSN